MTIAAKPTTYTVNTGHTHCPNHLWLMDEGSGTTLTDRGSTAGYDLTLTDTAAGSGPEWTTDTLGGESCPVLSFVAANGDRAQYASVSGLSGTHVAAVVAIGTAGTGLRTMLCLADASQADRFVALEYAGDEDVEAASRYDAAAVRSTSTQAMTATDYDFVAVKFSDTTIEWSLNGSAWSAAVVAHSGLLASITRIAIGAQVTVAPSDFWNNNIAAGMWWKASKSDAEIATIAADPWQFLDTSDLTAQQIQFYKRPSTLLRM